MRHQTLEHRFVRNIPRELDSGVLYISMDYATAVHSCCCGCGERVVTPFTPTDWCMTFDGESISLCPSVGNWNQKCQSHYVIQGSRVLEAGPWSEKQVESERRRDKMAKAAHYGKPMSDLPDVLLPAEGASTNTVTRRRSSLNLWSRLKSWLKG